MVGQGVLLIAEWNSVHLAKVAVENFVAMAFSELLEFQILRPAGAFALLQSRGSIIELSTMFSKSEGLVDFSIFSRQRADETKRAFYGLTNNLLGPDHSLGSIKTSSVPLGFQVAQICEDQLGRENILECKIARATSGGTQIFLGSHKESLNQLFQNLEDLLARSQYQKNTSTHWESNLIEAPPIEVRKLFSF
jgi:hypothetical protein